jgi:hypothetical protein
MAEAGAVVVASAEVGEVADCQRLRRPTGCLQRGIFALVTGLTPLQVKIQGFAQWVETEHQ